jgi:hypothetical protein
MLTLHPLLGAGKVSGEPWQLVTAIHEEGSHLLHEWWSWVYDNSNSCCYETKSGLLFKPSSWMEALSVWYTPPLISALLFLKLLLLCPIGWGVMAKRLWQEVILRVECPQQFLMSPYLWLCFASISFCKQRYLHPLVIKKLGSADGFAEWATCIPAGRPWAGPGQWDSNPFASPWYRWLISPMLNRCQCAAVNYVLSRYRSLQI